MTAHKQKTIKKYRCPQCQSLHKSERDAMTCCCIDPAELDALAEDADREMVGDDAFFLEDIGCK